MGLYLIKSIKIRFHYYIKHSEKNGAVFNKIHKSQNAAEEVDLNQSHGYLKNLCRYKDDSNES
jgi:hypothetical protein